MFLFSRPLYELLAREVCEVCAQGDPAAERVAELEREGDTLLFRFTPFREGGKLGFGRYRMETWCGEKRVSNDFDAERLRRLLR